MNDVATCPTAVARLFSASVVKELAEKGKSPTAARLFRESGLLPFLDPDLNLSQTYQSAFDFLKARQHRHEYVYKAAITRRVLLGIHNLATASMLTEFGAGRSRSDVVVLNGTASAYEIKSERDSLTRLSNQVDDYLKVFASVNIIAGQNHVKAILKCVPAEVGVLTLTNKFSISPEREAVDAPERTCPSAIFEVMNLREIEIALRAEGIETPSVPNTQMYSALKVQFEQLTSEVAHKRMVETLKRTRSQISLQSLLSNVPSSMHSATLSTKLRKRDHSRYIEAFGVPLSVVLSWA